MKKRAIIINLVLLLAVSCRKEPVTITLWTYYPEPYIEASEELIARFHAMQDDIRVELVSFPFNHHYQENVENALAEGTAGDLMLYCWPENSPSLKRER